MSYQQFLILAVSDDGWSRSATLRVGDHVGATCLENGNDRVRRPQIDPDDPPHTFKTCQSTLTAAASPFAQINLQQREFVKPFLVT